MGQGVDVESWDRAIQEQTKLEGRRSTVQAYSFLLVLSIVFLAVYIFIYVSDQDNIDKFGMTWAFVSMLIMYSLDFVASFFVLIGITRETINDVLVTLGIVLLIFACFLNFAIFFALPSEDEYGQPASWLGQDRYPAGCYYHYHRRGVVASPNCNKLRRLATAIWCSFIIFFTRMIILAVTKCTISYAKYGAPYQILIEPPPPTYVIAPQPYMQYGYGYHYPVASPYAVQYQTTRPVMVRQGDYYVNNEHKSQPPQQTRHNNNDKEPREAYRVQSLSESRPMSDDDVQRQAEPRQEQQDKPRFSYSSRRPSGSSDQL